MGNFTWVHLFFSQIIFLIYILITIKFGQCVDYRIIFGLVNVCVSDFFELHCASQTTGHPFKLYKERSYSSFRASYFSVRVFNVWNSLPADRVDFSSLAAFKQTIEQIDFCQFLLGYDS